jgi:hypothetical protein
MPFYRRRWNEPRGDDHDDWDAATYYCWIHQSVLEQQVEVCGFGVILAYDRCHIEDQFGGMSQVELNPDEWSPFEIDIDTYQREIAGQPSNRAA